MTAIGLHRTAGSDDTWMWVSVGGKTAFEFTGSDAAVTRALTDTFGLLQDVVTSPWRRRCSGQRSQTQASRS